MVIALVATLLILYLGDQRVNAYFNDVRPSHVIVGVVIAFAIVGVGIRRGWR